MTTSLWALVVGIAGYQRLAPLPAAVRDDALAVRDVLVDDEHCGYPPANVTLLLDREASRDAVLGALARIAAGAGTDASVVVYFSGHGGRDAGAEYLILADTDPERLGPTAISGAEFSAALRAIPARRVLVVLDCCHAGGVGRLKSGLAEPLYERLTTGRVILASSREDEFSYVLPGASHSLFTEHFLAGLRGGVPSDDGLVRVFDLFEYLQPRVTRDRRTQHPILKAHVEENFPVALRAGGRPEAPVKDNDGFRYDAYVSYADRTPDADWVWNVLVPRLERDGLRPAVSGDSGDPGVPHIVNAERGIRTAKRTVIVLSRAYLADHTAGFENVLAQSMGVREGTYRLLPILLEPINDLPVRLEQLTTLNVSDPARRDRDLDRLVRALHAPLPHRDGIS
ncbi:caspase family protein [Actinoplanes bogorensis]|uniref:Caspase family protein n=1 Tax=Paractinoplanes bogorensis TaxID=1610840 RepID=A0ABS5YSD2_9ACTN|nr:caspase family protein [Actinoplanes bogorensis]MBU2666263.1 caspase family protein [Actinoplanes bogorensis]